MNTKRKPPLTATIRAEHIDPFDALTGNQQKAADSWNDGKNLILSGSPGTGKTFIGLHFGLSAVLDKNTPFEKLMIIRSIVPTRDIGFLPGDEKEKKEAYIKPYVPMLAQMVGATSAWGMLNTQKTIDFESTSFIRGLTLDNTIVLVDEMQNLNFHELDSVITRAGLNTRLIFCGDYHQSDFRNKQERDGIGKFMRITDRMISFDTVKFGWEDIVRSDLVRDYIMTKEMLEEKSNVHNS